MLRVVNRLARSTTPTWSTCGEFARKSELAIVIVINLNLNLNLNLKLKLKLELET